ncbi:hypothetical protein SY86_18645 [Erwinia tracheiphila]|uniref:Uncharacterized protein n=1 Tax=Erwinia tracheiphila TaxID=65700 RepID=A0A0M2KCA5_9GAMM|nr:hypothetical protein ETR_12188 [Erwinia tracheiphila PSU-1]KKF36990.1 hypothetical protein SY86_18645 [Erwinia tracheiphila]
MLIAKIIGTVWMLAWFLFLFKIIVKKVNEGLDPFGMIFSLVLTWLLIGLAPVVIVKFGWGFIR